MNASVTLLITCSTVFLAQLGMSIYLPAVPEIALHLGAEAAKVSWGLSLYLIGMALPMLFWGSLAQRIGRKPVLLAALVIYGVANLALPSGSTLEAFLLLRLMQGVGASGISVMARVLIRDSFRGDLLARALSWISISFVVALGIGQYMGSLIEVTLGWQAIFYLLGVTCLLMALIVARVTFPAMADEPASASSWSAYRQILLHRAFLLPALAGGLGYGVIIAFNTAAPLILQGPFAWSSVDYGLLGWPISAAYFLGALAVNHFVLRTGQAWLMAVGAGLVLAGSSVMLLGSLTASSIALLFWLPYCVAVFGQSLNYPISLSRANDGAPIAGAYAMALSGFIHQSMAAIIGAMASLIASPQAWRLSLLCTLLAVGTMLCVRFAPMGDKR
ncbi:MULTISPECIES: MFS transporter [Pseudomonas]|uniref:MFS transporter n=1 Tax=Pseudomonas TaxID=286 RepID=UPI001240CE1B|nr:MULTISPECIES: MFS transporter [Pseudomonas]QHF49399.1 MFS transporter [Pseudomonas sp. S49]VVQ27175.1 Multidrug resistance protein MdtL [Pseudomonas fluorescens]